jgi:hypothetical protein
MTDEVLAQIVVMWAERGEDPEDVALKLHDLGHSWDVIEAVMLRATELIAGKQSAFMAHQAKE